MVPPRFGSGLYGCCAAHHRRGDPYYEKHLSQGRRASKQRTRERIEDREWRGRRVRIAIKAINDAGIGCQEIARLLRFSEMTIYDWRSGKRVPIARNADRVFKLADTLESRAA